MRVDLFFVHLLSELIMQFCDGRVPRPATLAFSLCLSLFVSLKLGSMPCWASEPLKANLVDGRQVVGNLDSRTDLDRLWISRAEDGIYFASGIRWADILGGEVENKSLTFQELQQWSVKASRNPARSGISQAAFPHVRNKVGVVAEQQARPSSASVKSLAIRAFVDHWDSDAQSDGVRIFVSALDQDGRLVQVTGQIDFTLMVERENHVGRSVSKSRPTFVPIARLNQRVQIGDFADGPAVYKLAFLKKHPEFDTSIASEGLLFARLAIPGVGVFEASDAQVGVREYSRFRDQLQLYSRSRYLPLENGGRSNP
jgi:hypothetical protein